MEVAPAGGDDAGGRAAGVRERQTLNWMTPKDGLPLVNALNSVTDLDDSLLGALFPIHVQDTNEEDKQYDHTQDDNPQDQASMLLAGVQANYQIKNVGDNSYLGWHQDGSQPLSNTPQPNWALLFGYDVADINEQLTGHSLVLSSTFGHNGVNVTGTFGLVWEADSTGKPTGQVTLEPNYLDRPTPQRCWEVRYMDGEVGAYVIRVSSVVVNGAELQEGKSWYLSATYQQGLTLADENKDDGQQQWIFFQPVPITATVLLPAPVQPYVPTPSAD